MDGDDKRYYFYTEGLLFNQWLIFLSNVNVMHSNGYGLLLCEDK